MDKIYLISFYVLKFIINILPNFAINGFANLVGILAYYIDKTHRKIVMINLNLCYGDSLSLKEKTQIAKNTYINFAKFGIDFIKNQNTTKEKILNKVSFKNEEILINALKTNRPIIVQTAHYGNWELFSLAMAAKFGAVSIIGRSLDSKVMDKILTKNRTQFNIELIEKSNAAKSIIKALKNRRLVGILTDQNTAKKDGIEVSFFKKRALHTPAASIFAQKMNALIIPAFIYKNSNKKDEICFFKAIDIKTFQKENAIQKATQLQSDATQKIIEFKPDEYFWFHKRFKHFYEEIYE
ncbi:lipid A biosynthesis lauroyl acyltransferase [Campylobacter sputorum]|uniref:lipid A biosynthesis lauroyl acyltransferase n=1 Tax=Campylobacter sputorum TaxID=206 RepID=UPI00053BDAD7|nr:lipid A biosynthesis lauroyl acyltransferase [Campylobacter sputorum]